MSTGPLTINVATRIERAGGARGARLSPAATQAVRISTFAALAAYGVVRWATLLQPAPSGRLLGMAGLATAMVAIVPALRRLGPPPAIAAAALMVLLALPIAGVRWHDFLHLRVGAMSRELGHGLSALPSSYVPYAGGGPAVRLIIVLGAAVLLLDAAIVLAFAPAAVGDGRRAAAALPLIALAVVPSTLLRPEFPYLQGFLLFGLLVAFLWAERVRRPGSGPALILLASAGVAGAVLAARVDQHHPWVNYRAWAGASVGGRLDSFAWNQTYGPLRWPRFGHPVLTVTAPRADYWKAEDLDVFNGYGWAAGQVSSRGLPAPSPTAIARWSETIHVEVTGLRSREVIAAGVATAPAPLGGIATPGDGPGTWVAQPPLTAGSSYTVTTYSPHPTAAQLTHDHGPYPNGALAAYRTLTLPLPGAGAARLTTVRFAPFGSGQAPELVNRAKAQPATAALQSSVYGSVYALARRLTAGAATPYEYASAVSDFLDAAYTYNENPPARRYPLVSFLFKDKIGYCQQFSGAMALLLRMAGVPARVAAGFTSGSPGGGDRWFVSDIDAHAWVEAWFPRYGWVRFDPTPAVAPARGGRASAGIGKKLPAIHLSQPAKPRSQLRAPAPRAPVTPQHAGGGLGLWVLAPGVLLVVLAALALIGLLAPEPSPEDRLRELERALTRTGRPLGADVTLAALERRFQDSPAVAGYIRGLRMLRYAGTGEPPDPRGRRALRAQLRRGLGASGRLRALWALPPRPRTALKRRRGRLN